MYVQPVILPAVAQKTVEIIISLEPRLKVNRRSIIVRRIHQFILVRSEIDREIPYAAQISAPPVEIIIAVVRGVIIPVAGYVYWIYLGSWQDVPSTIIRTLGFFASIRAAAVSAACFQLFAESESFHIAAPLPS